MEERVQRLNLRHRFVDNIMEETVNFVLASRQHFLKFVQMWTFYKYFYKYHFATLEFKLLIKCKVHR